MACLSPRPGVWLVAGALLIGAAGPAAPARAASAVAVFNFQMTSETPEWRWLEKGLSDRITTDLVRSRDLAVVARDEMQMLAQKMQWVPEMATSDPVRVQEIEQHLRVEYLVTGAYTVTDGEIRITGQIVRVSDRQEVARKEVGGKREDVIELQRGLSSELMGWFTKQPPAQILKELPVWTKSVPAMKVLYDGMDLYDQGRYGEAWLRFRQASREDPAYVEAVYWVGKMYYFMNRYEHARRALERFVYLDAVHPRLGDALVEYCHTYEEPGGAPEALLAMYRDLGVRYAGAHVWEGREWGTNGILEAGDWFRAKQVQVLVDLGRFPEAAPLIRHEPAQQAWALAGVDWAALATGRINAKVQEELSKLFSAVPWEIGDRGTPGVLRGEGPRRILGRERHGLDRMAAFDPDHVGFAVAAIGPPGGALTALEVQPIVEGTDG